MTNPLIQAYRKPALYIPLPSKGEFYKTKPKSFPKNSSNSV